MTVTASHKGQQVSGPPEKNLHGPETLRRRILLSHLRLAAIGLMALCAVLFVSVWQRNNIRVLVLEKGPSVTAALKAQSSIQQSESDLQGWVALNDEEFKKRRRLVWSERVGPALAMLKTLSNSWDSPARVATLNTGLELAAQLKISQWWVEDVAHTPGNNPAQTTYQTLLRPMERTLFKSLQILIDEQQQSLHVGLNTTLYLAMIKLREELMLCAAVLAKIHEYNLPEPPEITFLNHFDRAMEQSTLIKRRDSLLNSVQLDSLHNILRELSAYKVYAQKVFALWKDGPLDIAQQWMTAETVPLANQTMALFASLSNDLALQMRRDETRLRQISNAFAVFLGLGILMVTFGALVISRRQAARLVRPLADLTAASMLLADGQLDEMLPIVSDDEIGKLTHSFNSMAVQIQKRTDQLDERIKEAEKLNVEMAEIMTNLRISNQELEDFNSTVSHDLRAPLRHISGFVAALQDRAGNKLDSTAQEYLLKISGSAERLGKMIDDMLAFSRVGQTEVTMTTVDMDLLFREVRLEIDETYRTLKINWQIGNLPLVKGDLGSLRQVVRNLLDNAAKYSSRVESPSIVVRAERVASEVIFSIRDNGAGFDPAYTDKLFNVFQRLHREGEFEGNGIGLASVRRIILRHGGWVKAESQVGQGACFRFALLATDGDPYDSAEL